MKILSSFYLTFLALLSIESSGNAQSISCPQLDPGKMNDRGSEYYGSPAVLFQGAGSTNSFSDHPPAITVSSVQINTPQVSGLGAGCDGEGCNCTYFPCIYTITDAASHHKKHKTYSYEVDFYVSYSWPWNPDSTNYLIDPNSSCFSSTYKKNKKK